MGYVIVFPMSMSKMKNRYYTIEIILYLDNQEHLLLLKDLISKYKYAYILHDKDKNTDGTLKKEHIHLLIFFDNARWGTAILKEIKIDNSNLIEFKDNKYDAIRYLTHCDNEKKYQYNYNDIVSNIDIDMYFNNYKDSETKNISLLFDFIQNYVGFLYFHQVYYFALNNNIWSSYRRNYLIIKDLINEHNSNFVIDNYD